MIYCKKCVYPKISVLLNINEDGICSACKSHERFDQIDEKTWKKKEEQFEKIISEKKNDSDYDCIIPVSGGKDSYYQTHMITQKYNLKPLLVTYDHNNWLDEGKFNREEMRKKFNADHIMWGPSEDILKKLNRITFKKIGDMNWHDHCGIFTAPVIIAVKFKIPLIIWGETEWDIAGMYTPEDIIEFSYRSRHENSLRGYEWFDFVNDDIKDHISEKDMNWAKYPSDQEIISSGVKGIYLGNFFKWDGKLNADLAIKKYKWRPSQEGFERTYRNFSNVDNRYSNGVSDLLKFIKFGYGRCTDHVSKDLRNKHMQRDEGIDLVKKHDHIISKDLTHWLNYVDMTSEEFWKIADTFRDPRVWRIKSNKWFKDNIWGEESSYGDVHLDAKQVEEFKNKQKNI